jgi:hypothetical protein
MLSRPTPQYSPHSHSIVSTHCKALIYKRKFLLTMLEARTTSRQNFSLMIPKENSGDLNLAMFQRLSTTIGRFFASSIIQRNLRQDQKRPSAPVARQSLSTKRAQ